MFSNLHIMRKILLQLELEDLHAYRDNLTLESNHLASEEPPLVSDESQFVSEELPLISDSNQPTAEEKQQIYARLVNDPSFWIEYYSSRGISPDLLSVEQVYTTYARDLKYKIADYFLSYINHELWITRDSLQQSKGLRFLPEDKITPFLFSCCTQIEPQHIFDYFTFWTESKLDNQGDGFEIVLFRESPDGEYWLDFTEWESDYHVEVKMTSEEAREVIYRLVQLKVNFTDIYENDSIPYPK